VKDLLKLARVLAEERRTQKLKVEDVAQMSGYCADYIMKLECGQGTPSFGALTAWAQSLGYEVVLRRKDE
jgi:transcriptional regulator with XRE-family HTH domain